MCLGDVHVKTHIFTSAERGRLDDRLEGGRKKRVEEDKGKNHDGHPKGGHRPDRDDTLMYGTNLSWKNLREYITSLKSAGLMKLRNTGRREICLTTENPGRGSFE
jgi:hypothetical protein